MIVKYTMAFFVNKTYRNFLEKIDIEAYEKFSVYKFTDLHKSISL